MTAEIAVTFGFTHCNLCHLDSAAEATLEVLRAAQTGLEAVVTCPTGVIGPYDFRDSMMDAVTHNTAAAKPALYVNLRDVANGLISATGNGKHGER